MTATAKAPKLPEGVAFIEADGHRLEYVSLPGGDPEQPTLVFLHEALGCIDLWRDFPRRVAEACGCPALVYSRYGHGRSQIRPHPPDVTYLHHEALVVLPQVLDTLHIRDPILVGHSDGASIALLHAAYGERPVRGLVLMAPHEFVEEQSLVGLRAARQAWENTDLAARLGRYHHDAQGVFLAWNTLWLSPQFRAWNIEDCLPEIHCPILAIQGVDDEYGSLRQIEVIAEEARDVDLVALADCRHTPHQDQPEAVLAAIERFVERVL